MLLYKSDGFLERDTSLEVIDHFLVPDCRKTRAVRIIIIHNVLSFFKKSILKHSFDSFVNSSIEFSSITIYIWREKEGREARFFFAVGFPF